jgi:beta-xylosidase
MTLRYTNPVWQGYMADPFVLRRQDAYYAYGTGGPEADGRQADGNFFPLLRSADLVHWEYLGGALRPLRDGGPAYWAPEVAERDGRFFLYYSTGGRAGEGHKLRVATADRPEGPFEDAGRLLFPDEPFSIDADPFRDPRDGRWILFFSKDFFDAPTGTGIAAAPLADDMLSVTAPPQTILRASAEWQLFERNRFWYDRTWDAWYTVEGACVVGHEGRYYCLYSGGRWETPAYGVSVAVADNALGPYREETQQKGPRVLRAVEGKVFGPGHNSVVVGPDGRSFLVYHAWNVERTKRQMCIDPLLWTPDGPRCAGPTWAEETLLE